MPTTLALPQPLPPQTPPPRESPPILGPDADGITMTVYFMDGSERTIEANTTYETPLLPGFQLPVGRLFQIADQWADEG